MMWDLVDEGVFDGLTRDGNKVRKTYGGSLKKLMKDVVDEPHCPDNSSCTCLHILREEHCISPVALGLANIERKYNKEKKD